MSQDNATVARLRAIADDLEALAGITEQKALSRDVNVASQLKRIHDAIVAELESIEAELTTFVSAGGLRTLAFSIQGADSTKTHAGRGTKSFGAWFNDTGATFTISRVRAVSDADNYAFLLFKSASFTDLSTTNDTQIASIACADDGTSAFTANVTTFDSATVESGKWIIWEHSSGTANSVSVMIEGTFA